MDDYDIEDQTVGTVKKEDGTRDWELLRKRIYKKYPKEELEEQFLKFHQENLDVTYLNDAGKSTGKISIHFFRPVQYKAKNIRAKYTPDEVLQSDELLEEAFRKIDKKADYYNMGSDDKNFISFITNEASMVSKVAIFSANLARKIYERWCPRFGANIHDASSGWGNRACGALASKYDYNYFGTDPNSELQACYKAQADFIKETLHDDRDRCDIRCQGSEVFVPEWEGKMDLSFTSPPYFNTERYCEETTQSAIKNANYTDWRDSFARPTIKNVYRYLKPGSYYLINLKNLTPALGGFPAFNDWVNIAQEEGFILESVQIMHYQSTRQFGTSKKTGKKREVNFLGDIEPVGVMRKPRVGEDISEISNIMYPSTLNNTWKKGKRK